MPMINRTCGTAIEGARFITLLISGNNVSTVEANSPCIICSDKVEICKYTSQKGIYYPLSGYNMDKTVGIGTENIVMSEEKIYNLKKLDRIAQLEDGWNGNTAKVFEGQFISKVRRIITALEVQPELFPTACDSVQIEYEKEDGSYLEIEITSEDMWEVFEINKEGKECFFSISADIEAINKVVNSFYE